MRNSLLQILVDPVGRRPLQVEVGERAPDGEILHGQLRAEGGSTYEIRNGIPRFVPREEQQQTATSFGYKWKRRETYEFDHYVEMIRRDEVPRWGLESVEQFYDMFRNRARVLDAGCGSGGVSFELARRVGPSGRMIGLDLDETLPEEQHERLP